MKKELFLFILFFAGIFAQAQSQSSPQWNSILSNQPETFQTKLISSSEESIKVNVQVPGFYTTNVTTPRGEASIISLPKSVSTAHVGEPNVPMTGIPVMIGDRTQMSVRIVDSQYLDFEGIDVAPSKGDFPRTVDPATVPYTYGECYDQDAFFPANNVELYEPYIIRDFRGQNMAVYPFAYNPVSKTLRVYFDMTIEMYKVSDNGVNVIEARKSNTIKIDQDFKNVYQRHFINYESGVAKYTPLEEEGDLLIICHDSFISSMTDFVNWKKTRGVNTTIVGTSTISSSLTYSNLKTYIQNQYNANNNLTHVLLVGDVAQIPGYTYSGASGYEGKGDNPYGQVAGSDIYNDLFVGRFSAQTVAQVQTQVQRVITYERDLTTSATWCQNGEGIGKTEGNSSQAQNGEEDYEHIELIRGDLVNYGYNTVYQDYASTSGYSCSATTISNHFNSGVGIGNYCNHGNYQMWGVASYSNVQVNALTNENKLPFIWSTACYVGAYDNTETSYGSGYTVGQSNDCFAEAWMHATNSAKTQPTGAIGVLMSYISQPWQPPMWGQDECVDILVESYSNNIKHTWGGTSINGIMGIFDHYSTSTAEAVGTYQAWVLYGDPSMMLRTKTPQAMTVTHPGNITLGTTSYTVNVSNGNGALATITDANHNILGRATVSNGTANITISDNQTPNAQFTLCVFGYNKVTYLGTIDVVGGTQYNITCNQPEHGSISAPEQAYGSSTVTLTATPETGYCLSSWDVRDASNHSITVTNNQFTMPESDVTVSANFVQGMAVTLASVTNGSISADPMYALQGNTVNLTATPTSGYEFNSWVVYKTGDVNTTVTVNGNSFTMPNYPVTVSAIFLAPAGGDVTVGSGTGTTNGNYLPTNVWYKYSLTQQIYTKAELGDAGTITAISFYYNSSTDCTRTLEIYMTHTTSTTISSWQTQSSSDLVYSGSLTFSQGWNTITLNTPFAYDGSSNLLLTVDDNTGSYSVSGSTYFYTYSTDSNRAIRYYSDSSNLSATSSNSTSGTTAQYNAQLQATKEVSNTDGYLSVSPNALSGFNYAEGEGPSETQSVAIIGANLQDNLGVTPPSGYEVSDNGSTFSTALSLTPSNGSLQQMLYVRLAANLSEGNYNGTMTLASGTTTQNVDLNGEVTEGTSQTITQTSTFSTGWNPWTPNVDLDGATLLSELKQALGTNGISITAQNGKFLSYNPTANKWKGTLSTIDVGSMYKIKTANSCEISLNGPTINPATHAVTIYPGNNWIGFFGTESMSIEQALANYTPTQGDKIIFNNMSSSFNGTKWNGTISELVPGNGYIYNSKATTTQTLFYNSGKK